MDTPSPNSSHDSDEPRSLIYDDHIDYSDSSPHDTKIKEEFVTFPTSVLGDDYSMNVNINGMNNMDGLDIGIGVHGGFPMDGIPVGLGSDVVNISGPFEYDHFQVPLEGSYVPSLNRNANANTWPATCAPSDLLSSPLSVMNSSGNTSMEDPFAYDFSFNPSSMEFTVPSPPSSTSGNSTHSGSISDPPSPRFSHHPVGIEITQGTALADLPLAIPTISSTSLGSNPNCIPPLKKTLKPPITTPKDALKDKDIEKRTKTSHTTIERRYRTNLNARIIGLRLAVPALRVLDKSVAATDDEDKVDERGYVDGVKAAKKNSKAVILGKATEYIMVLKRRESRLTAHLAAMRSLLISLLPPGDGAAFLERWEEEYRKVNGDARCDELQAQEGICGDGEEEDDDEREEEEEEINRKKKKVRKEATSGVSDSLNAKGATFVSPSSTILATPVSPIEGMPPVKRKRGRPRKIQPPPATSDDAHFTPVQEPISASNSASMPLSVASTASTESLRMTLSNKVIHRDRDNNVAEDTQQLQPLQAAPQQHLLAVFAFFTLLTSSTTSYQSSTSNRSGTVLNPTPISVAGKNGWINEDLVRATQLITSMVILLSVIGPYVLTAVREMKAKQQRFFSTLLKEPGVTKPGITEWLKSISVDDVASYVERVLLEGRIRQLSVFKRLILYRALHTTRVPIIYTTDAESSYSTPIPILRALLAHSLPFPFASILSSEEVWMAAKKQYKFKYNKGVSDALTALKTWCSEGKSMDGMTVKLILERDCALDLGRDLLARDFIATVMGGVALAEDEEAPDSDGQDEVLDWVSTGLVDVLSPSTPSKTYGAVYEKSTDPREKEIKELFLATSLFELLFPSHVHPSDIKTCSNRPIITRPTTVLSSLSPPRPANVCGKPNGAKEQSERSHELRCLLGSCTFESSIKIDKARDFVVGLLEQQ